MIFVKTIKNNLLSDVAMKWLTEKEDIKIQTYQKYENIICQHIENSIGKIPIKKINKKVIEKFFNDLEMNNTSKSIQRTILYILKATLNFGAINKYCKQIDLKELKIAKSKVKIETFTKNEQLIIEDYLKEKINIRKLCVLLCLYTGLRVGEVCGLKWEDIDLNNKTLEIKRTIERVKNVNPNIKSKTILIAGPPKTETSYRVVPIADFLIPLLKQFKTNDNYFLLSNSEKLYDPRSLQAFFKSVLVKCNIKTKKFHTLRHTFATRCIESKIDVKTLSELLGHADIETTLNIYVHPSIDLKKNSIEDVVSFMCSPNPIQFSIN